jgi:TRAP-type C4-dicarboxylate transport system permease small subunit
MRQFLRLIDAACALGAGIGAAACLALAVMLIVEVVATSFFNWSQPWAVEYSGYLLAMTLFAGSGWTLARAGHIRVAVVTQLLPAKALLWADGLATVFSLGVALFVTWACIGNAMRSFELGSESFYPSRTPVWAPQAMLAFGWVVLCLGLLARTVRLVTGQQAEDAAQPLGERM